MEETLVYEYAPKSVGRGYQRNGTRLERVTETDVLHQMMEEGYACNVEKGWFDEDRTFGDDIALLHSEVSEMLEAFRVTGDCEDQTEESNVHPDAPAKPEGVGAEAADVLVRLLDTCKRRNIDLFAEWRRKMDYNWTRSARHGGKAL